MFSRSKLHCSSGSLLCARLLIYFIQKKRAKSVNICRPGNDINTLFDYSKPIFALLLYTHVQKHTKFTFTRNIKFLTDCYYQPLINKFVGNVREKYMYNIHTCMAYMRQSHYIIHKRYLTNSEKKIYLLFTSVFTRLIVFYLPIFVYCALLRSFSRCDGRRTKALTWRMHNNKFIYELRSKNNNRRKKLNCT